MSSSTSRVQEVENCQVITDRDLTVKQKDGIYLVILPNCKRWVAANEEGYRILEECKKGTTVAQLKRSFDEINEEDLLDFVEEMIRRGILYINKEHMENKSEISLGNPERLTLWIHLTHACNLHCVHCDVDAGTPKKEELTPSEIETCVKDSLRIAPGIDLDLTGGEPLLRKDIFEILDRLTTIPHVEISLLTNGTLIDEEIASRLSEYFTKKSGLRAIQVSLDGASKHSHEFIRGVNTFERTLEGITLLRKFKCEVEVACILTSLSIKEFNQYLEIMAQLGVSRVQTPVIKPIGRAVHLEDKGYFCSQLNAARALFEILKGNDQKKRELVINLFLSDLISMVLSTGKIIKCAAGTHALCVESNGDVYPCPSFTEHASYNLGNVREQSLFHIYEASPLIQQFKKLSLPQAVEECHRCEFRYFCGGGCMVENLSSSGDILKSPFRCAERKELIEEMMVEITQKNLQLGRLA